MEIYRSVLRHECYGGSRIQIPEPLGPFTRAERRQRVALYVVFDSAVIASTLHPRRLALSFHLGRRIDPP